MEEYKPGYYMVDAIEAVATIDSKALKAEAKVLNCIAVEDIIIREGKVVGLVINLAAGGNDGPACLSPLDHGQICNRHFISMVDFACNS